MGPDIYYLLLNIECVDMRINISTFQNFETINSELNTLMTGLFVTIISTVIFSEKKSDV